MTTLHKGDTATLTPEELHTGVHMGVERFCRDRIAGIVDTAADAGVHDADGRRPWCTIDIHGVLAEIAFAKLTGTEYDRTLHARAETGGFDTILPNGLYVDVKWAEGPGRYGNMLLQRNKVNHLQGRDDVVCVLMHGTTTFNQDLLQKFAHRMPRGVRAQQGFCRRVLDRLDETVNALLVPEAYETANYSFVGWFWGDHAVDPEMWAPRMQRPCFRVAQRQLLDALPVGSTRPERRSLADICGLAPVSDPGLADLTL